MTAFSKITPYKLPCETGQNSVWELSVIARPLAMETSRGFRLPIHLALVELITCTGLSLNGLNASPEDSHYNYKKLLCLLQTSE